MTATILMTDPTHFEIRYAINPWMRPSEWLSNPAGHKQSARLAWDGLRSALSEADASIEVVPAAAGWPDMVFPANAAVVLNGSALLARFRHPERQGEQPAFRAALERLVRRGLLHDIAELPAGLIHEGAGDCVWDAARKIFWAGYGPRSDSVIKQLRQPGKSAFPYEEAGQIYSRLVREDHGKMRAQSAVIVSAKGRHLQAGALPLPAAPPRRR